MQLNPLIQTEPAASQCDQIARQKVTDAGRNIRNQTGRGTRRSACGFPLRGQQVGNAGCDVHAIGRPRNPQLHWTLDTRNFSSDLHRDTLRVDIRGVKAKNSTIARPDGGKEGCRKYAVIDGSAYLELMVPRLVWIQIYRK